MIYNGYRVCVSHPLKTYRFESRAVKAKVGPKHSRVQRIKVFAGYVHAVADGDVMVDHMHKRMYVNPKTFDQLEKELGSQSVLSPGPAMRGCW